MASSQQNMGWWQWGAQEVEWGVRQNITGIYNLVVHPIESTSNLFNAVLHPIQTVTAVGKQFQQHPLGMGVNFGISFATGALLKSGISAFSTVESTAPVASSVAIRGNTTVCVAEIASSPAHLISSGALTTATGSTTLVLDIIKESGQVAQQTAQAVCSGNICTMAASSSSSSLSLTQGALTTTPMFFKKAAKKQLAPKSQSDYQLKF